MQSILADFGVPFVAAGPGDMLALNPFDAQPKELGQLSEKRCLNTKMDSNCSACPEGYLIQNGVNVCAPSTSIAAPHNNPVCTVCQFNPQTPGLSAGVDCKGCIASQSNEAGNCVCVM